MKENLLAEKLKGQIKHLKNRKNFLTDRNNKLSFYRLITFLIGTAVSLGAFFFINSDIMLLSIALFLVFFFILAHSHSKVLRALKQNNIYLTIKKENLARLTIDWDNIPEHPLVKEQTAVERDLDLIGKRSILQLINLSFSLPGFNKLKEKLNIDNPVLDDVKNRQEIIKEIKNDSVFSDRFVLASRIISTKQLNIDNFHQVYPKEKDYKSLKRITLLLSILAPINLTFILLYIFTSFPALWGFSVLIYLAFYYLNSKKIKNVGRHLDYLLDSLNRLDFIFDFIEKYNYKNSPKLKELVKPVTTGKIRPSTIIKKLKKILEVLQMRGNPFIWSFFLLIAPLDYIMAKAFYANTYHLKKYLPEWMSVIYNLEELVSFGKFAALNPEYVFPELSEEKLCLHSKNLGHPLIEKDEKVKNDVSFNKDGEIKVITGSNMSGKSTFLRTVGTSIVLAYAGAPVDADDFKISSLKLFSCIRVSDSVVDGISYFYSEVKRLKILYDLSLQDDNNVIFLIDEIFKGTNNKERLIGSTSFIKSLSDKNLIGMISTHDLDLSKLENEINCVTNFHFKEEIEENKMKFNYKFLEGPCPSTNALKILEMEGLPIE